MTSYPAKSIKYDPVSGAVAVRTFIPEDKEHLAGLAWLASYPGNEGARHHSTVYVESWTDMTPPA